MADEFDVICLGAGPAGEALTRTLEGKGLRLAIIEQDLVGGECAYWGCIPSKTLLRSAEVLAEAGRARQLSASAVEWTLDRPRIERRIAENSRHWDDRGAAQALERAGATVIRGEAHLTGRDVVEVGPRRLRARRAVVIATGTRPAVAPITGIDQVPYWTNREAIKATALPSRLIIVGSGAVGVELAQGYARLGSKVHLVEAAERILALEEPEASAGLARAFEQEGIEMTTGARISRVERGDGTLRVITETGVLEGDQLLVATGRRPNTGVIDAAASGVTIGPRGSLSTDPATLEAGERVFAIGDVTGLGGFTHLSDYHGVIAGRRLLGEDARADHRAVPRVTFTDPEVASAGQSEQQARAAGVDVVTVLHDVGDTARGFIHAGPGGCVKLIADRERGVLVGATIVSPRAGEMLSELTLAIKQAIPVRVLADLIHPFPTFSRILQGMLAELDARTRTTGAARR
ncbi:MAG TPA: NAD(P)/FAD-dependent oxidoreductase [Candidatus Limnocylindrales bacterium]|nr:NAD(P)/FAD-dependent oxidoreductase [Candidatus Limnocylindrales bacterium]